MTGSRGAPAGLIDALVDVVGAHHVLTEDLGGYESDWSGRWSGSALAAVRPGTTAETAAVVRLCAEADVSMQVQGGNTGLVGGSTPQADMPAIVISTRRLTGLEPVDEISGQVTVGAGTTLGDLHRHAATAGWEYGVDLAARDSATVGGTVATNAGGIRVIAHGMTRAQVTGIEAVLPDGSVVSHLAGLAKDNTGYDLAGLLTGSEGTLGVITAVRVRLHRPHAATSVALIGISDYAEGLGLLRSAVRSDVVLLAAEFTDATGMDLASQMSGLGWPLAGRHPLVLLLEIADGGDGSGFESGVLEDRDVVVGLQPTEKERLWSFRELQGQAFTAHAAAIGAPPAHKLDISIPLDRISQCADDLRARMEDYPGVVAFGVFGHLGDGNIHVEIVGPAEDDEEVDRQVLSIVGTHGGSVSAEHGIGRAKTGWLGLSRSPTEIAAMRAIKQALDPRGLMNPGVLFT